MNFVMESYGWSMSINHWNKILSYLHLHTFRLAFYIQTLICHFLTVCDYLITVFTIVLLVPKSLIRCLFINKQIYCFLFHYFLLKIVLKLIFSLGASLMLSKNNLGRYFSQVIFENFYWKQFNDFHLSVELALTILIFEQDLKKI